MRITYCQSGCFHHFDAKVSQKVQELLQASGLSLHLHLIKYLTNGYFTHKS